MSCFNLASILGIRFRLLGGCLGLGVDVLNFCGCPLLCGADHTLSFQVCHFVFNLRSGQGMLRNLLCQFSVHNLERLDANISNVHTVSLKKVVMELVQKLVMNSFKKDNRRRGADRDSFLTWWWHYLDALLVSCTDGLRLSDLIKGCGTNDVGQSRDSCLTDQVFQLIRVYLEDTFLRVSDAVENIGTKSDLDQIFCFANCQVGIVVVLL
mmetsp:Transcript_7860/g.15201  ORF Transcript_7860/g.15201 Transcript_7860/m.15201 type:complete len:210 (-) Transcript_7860:1582-2211(-)